MDLGKTESILIYRQVFNKAAEYLKKFGQINIPNEISQISNLTEILEINNETQK